MARKAGVAGVDAGVANKGRGRLGGGGVIALLAHSNNEPSALPGVLLHATGVAVAAMQALSTIAHPMLHPTHTRWPLATQPAARQLWRLWPKGPSPSLAFRHATKQL